MESSILSTTFQWIISLQLVDPALQSSTTTVVGNLIRKLRERPGIGVASDVSQVRDVSIAHKCPAHVLQTYIDGKVQKRTGLGIIV